MANGSYSYLLHRKLRPPTGRRRGPIAIDLFSGCGGLALGFEAAGFRTIGYEADPNACQTYRKNIRSPCHQTNIASDIELPIPIDVIIGGPPCQPFSVLGRQRGRDDSRNGIPAFLCAVHRNRPKLALFENVRGMLFRNRSYLDTVIQQLRNMDYTVDLEILNAADFGVPQNRQRLFVVAHDGSFRFPLPDQRNNRITVAEALDGVLHPPEDQADYLTPAMDAYIERYEQKSKCIRPRDLHLDRPSRTVTCRNLSGATGDMLRLQTVDGRRRRLTVREAARLQSFPDWFDFVGSQASQFNQLGNAVPPLLSKAIALAVIRSLGSHSYDTNLV